MNHTRFSAFVVSENSKGEFLGNRIERSIEELPPNEVLIRVLYSSLNYKDALSASGHKGITKNYPHTPGIDAAGVVEQSSSLSFAIGDKVIVTGYDLGMNTSGGFGQYIRVPAAWVVPLPQGLTLKESMMLGTAGFTAAYAVYKLIACGQSPGAGPILVTGATGGVGSLSVALLSSAGFQVIAATGKSGVEDYLLSLGASAVIHRNLTNDTSGKALLRPRWAGAVDTVGGNILATAMKACLPHGNVASLGNVLSADLNISVFPFILNGINLLGIDSATCPMAIRKELWNKLACEWKPAALEKIASGCTLDEIIHFIDEILQGNILGRKYIQLWPGE